MQSELSEIIKQAVIPSMETFQTAIGKVVENMVNQVGFWKEWVDENNGAYDFLGVLQKGIWSSMLKTNPAEIGEWSMHELMEAWKKAFPEEFSAIVNAETERELKRVTEALEFERKCARQY